MANNAPNLKVKATMDNSDIKKKSQESKEALRDFQKTGTDAVNRLGEAFGVNTGKIDGMLSSLRGLGLRLQESGNAGYAAFGKMLQGINGVTAGIAGLGLAGALATFKLLSSEAENFKNTVAGANLELETTAYIDTYRQVIHDFNRELGEGFAETESGWKKFWGTIGSTMKAYLTSGAAFQGALPGATTVGVSGANTQQLNTFLQTTQQASEAAAKAEAYQKRIYTIQRLLSDSVREWSQLETEIAEQKRIAWDVTNDIVVRQEALAKAVELTKQRYEDEHILRGRLATMQEKMNNLAESSIADIDKANQLRAQEDNALKTMNDKLREMSEKQKTLTVEAQKEAQARADALAAAQQMAQSRADLKAWTEGAAVSQIETPGATAQNVPGIIVPVKAELDTQQVIDVTNELQSIVTSSFENIGVSLGNLLGDLVTGEDAWGNFANSAISAFGDMAIAVGRMAVSTGVATLGIKAALESLNGAVAIAAGVALIAIGSAIKSGLSNVAAGNYSASSNVASATGSYGSSASNLGTGFENREITVKVTGTLRGEGNQLLSVIENENKRKKHTT